MSSFNERCYQLLIQVPKGRVTTYQAIAHAMGCKGYRAVGHAMNQNPNAPQVPCHRVVKSNGCLGGYAFGEQAKIDLLKSEGVEVEQGRVVNFNDKCFHFDE